MSPRPSSRPITPPPPRRRIPTVWTVGKLLCTKETWLCVLSTGFLMLVQMGIMTQLVARNMEVGMNQALATGVMSAIAVIGVIGSVIIGRIVFKLGIKKAGVMTAVLYVVALLCNISGIMPLVWISLVIIGFLGAAAPNLMNSIPGSVFWPRGLRQGQQRGLPDHQHHLYVQLRRQRHRAGPVPQHQRGLYRVSPCWPSSPCS